MRRRLRDQPFDDLRAARATDECLARLVASNLSRQSGPVCFADIWEIRDDRVDRFEAVEQAAEPEFDAVIHANLSRIALREMQRIRRRVDRDDTYACWRVHGNGDGDCAGARANVSH